MLSVRKSKSLPVSKSSTNSYSANTGAPVRSSSSSSTKSAAPSWSPSPSKKLAFWKKTFSGSNQTQNPSLKSYGPSTPSTPVSEAPDTPTLAGSDHGTDAVWQDLTPKEDIPFKSSFEATSPNGSPFMLSSGRFDDTFPFRKPTLEVQRQPFSDLETTFEPLSPLDTIYSCSSRRESASSCCTFPQSCSDDQSDIGELTEATASEIHFRRPSRCLSFTESFASSGVLPEHAAHHWPGNKPPQWQPYHEGTFGLERAFPEMEDESAAANASLILMPARRRFSSIDSQIEAARGALRSSGTSQDEDAKVPHVKYDLTFSKEAKAENTYLIRLAAEEGASAERPPLRTEASNGSRESNYEPAIDLVVDWAERQSMFIQLDPEHPARQQTFRSAPSVDPLQVDKPCRFCASTFTPFPSPSSDPAALAPEPTRFESPAPSATTPLAPPPGGSAMDGLAESLFEYEIAPKLRPIRPLRLKTTRKDAVAPAEVSPKGLGRAATSRWSADSIKYEPPPKSPVLGAMVWRSPSSPRPSSASKPRRSASTGPVQTLPTIYADSVSSSRSSPTLSPRPDRLQRVKSSRSSIRDSKHRSLSSWFGMRNNKS